MNAVQPSPTSNLDGPAGSSALEPIWLIGLSGHRILKNPSAVADSLNAILEALCREIHGSVGCVSSVAIGADTLFAQAALAHSLPWRALLPAPPAEFQRDFEPEDWKIAEQLLSKAVEVDIRVTPASKNEAYLECGMDTVDQSDLLVAVWDEQPARGTGGTGDVVAYARSLRKPVVILNPDTLVVSRERLDGEAFRDPEMDYLNALPDSGAAKRSVEVPESLMRFFTKVDRMAARIAPNFRRWVASSIVMNTCATILVASTIAYALRLPLLDTMIFAMTAGAIAAVVWLKFRKVHQRWVHCRVAAEICRAAIATWDLPKVALLEIPGQPEAFTRLKTSIRMLHLCSRPAISPSIEELRSGYIERRINDQAQYHLRRRLRLEALRRRLITLFWVCSALAVARAIFVGAFGTDGLSEAVVHTLSHFLPLALPCLAGCALALVSVFDLNREIVRSEEMESFLARAREQAEACANIHALQRAIARTERYLAREVADWFTLSQEPRYG